MTREHSSASLQVELRSDGVAVVRFDSAGEALNTLKAGFAEELSAVLSNLEQVAALKAVVFTSGKPDSFIAGADIHLLQAIERAEQACELSKAGQRVLARLDAFPVPVVAAIHGPCLGGGLELALACRARVASTDPKTKLGLPEVQLGVLPALGGTQRLPHLLGIESALDLLLTGKQIDGKRALDMGLIDALVPKAILLEVAARLALARTSTPTASKSRLRRWLDPSELREFALAENPVGRRLLFERAKKQVRAKTQGNYPAPERILEVVRLGLAEGLERGQEAEASAFGALVVSDVARALMHVFFARHESQKDSGLDVSEVAARSVGRVAILGAGPLGAGIAYVSAVLAGAEVRLKDRDEAALGKGLKYVRAQLDERVDEHRIEASERDRSMARLTATTNYDGFDAVDLVIEGVFEDLNVTQQVLAEVEEGAGKNTIFASNACCLPLARIASRARRPEQVIGMRYFSPVHETPLLEIAVTDATLARVTATCVEFGKRQGKTVIVVRDGAGFYTSRILYPYLSEASFLLAEGVAIERIDRTLVAWGFPVGPLASLDELGLDVGAKVGQVLHEAYGARMAPAPGIEALLKDERFGKKNRRGYYVYDQQAKAERVVDTAVYSLLGVEPNRQLSADQIAQRCALRMINEAAYCFGEGILQSARDGDLGAVFGLGFPPFRGGPFHYVDAAGAADIVRRLEGYAGLLGARFTPAPVLSEMARMGRTFYGSAAVAVGQHRD